MRVATLAPEFVESFPSTLEPGVLYVSIEFTTCAHLCACGCGEEVFTPLSPAQWSFAFNGRDISMRPSIGNWTLPCQSHYIIERGRVTWSYQFTKEQIAANRARDRRALRTRDEPEAAHEASEAAISQEQENKRTNRFWTRMWSHIWGG
ncbi:DUF6527 family protein [Nocardioides zhouii]|uniref:Uncharacterized protein n=1 Tax=Nocardioides zhouii TaxID=1168729 RepID=A0A4Q2SWR8_9ACTN|nr:DUF6527 family protein [Nocardioides zhouii]RYC10555.1 hypothetical protein EUA94_12210 [Nocardioides zhouii]